MIHEFALEPELVATWRSIAEMRYYRECFAQGRGRVVSQYPKSWKKRVWQAFRSANDIERKRFEEFLARLSERLVRREGLWNEDVEWLPNAEMEHARVPFRAIVARSNPREHAAVLQAADLSEESPAWAVERGRAVQRTPEDLAGALAPMLRSCGELIFVDPNFGPENARHRRPLEAILRTLAELRPGALPARIEVQTKVISTAEFFRDETRLRMPRLIPAGLRVRFIRLSEKPGGEKLHNRYVLTDLGGVMLGTGLDDGSSGQSDDINLLDPAQFEFRWRQYASERLAFNREEPSLEVDGVWDPRARRGR